MPVFFREEQQCIQVKEMATACAWLVESEMICYCFFFFLSLFALLWVFWMGFFRGRESGYNVRVFPFPFLAGSTWEDF